MLKVCSGGVAVIHFPFWMQSQMRPLRSNPSSAGQGEVKAFSDKVGRAGGEQLEFRCPQGSRGCLAVLGRGLRQFGVCLVTLVLQLHQALLKTLGHTSQVVPFQQQGHVWTFQSTTDSQKILITLQVGPPTLVKRSVAYIF